MKDHDRHIPVAVAPRRAFAKGGLASSAKRVADSGVGGDTMIVHVNKGEFDQMRAKFGEPTLNPHTQMPQFTPFYQQSWFAPVAGVAASALGGGSAVGGFLNDTLGLGLGDVAANSLGSGLIGAGIGGVSNGAQGALLGGLAGAATPLLTSAISGGSSGGGFGSLFGGSSSGASSGSGSAMQRAEVSGADAGGSTGGSSSSGGALSGAKGSLPYIIGGLLLANTIGAAANAGKPNAATTAAAANQAAAAGRANQPLPQASFAANPIAGRTRAAPLSMAEYLNYGKGPAQNYFTNNAIPTIGQPQAQPQVLMAQQQALARGGMPHPMPQQMLAPPAGALSPGAVSGPGDGRADAIPAKLSNNEYVVDAETTSLLGNGSPDAGAAKLDQMRQNIRKHKGGALAQGKFTPNAKSPEQYMMGGK